MKKFILNIFSFIIFTGLFYITVLFFWGQYAPSNFQPNINYKIGSYGYTYSRLSDVKKVKEVDILFLGSSHSYRGFDTRIFSKNGFKTFNLGSSSQTPIQTEVLLDRYLDNLNPKTIIYEVYPPSFISDGVESSLDIIANDRNDLASLKMVLKINNIKTTNTFLYALPHDIFGLNESFTEPFVRNEDIYVSGGFVEKKRDFFEPGPDYKKEILLNQKQLESFSNIVSLIRAKNIELILVYTPVSHIHYDSFSGNDSFDSIMNNCSEYYNFNKIISLDDSLHFYDSHHLNQNGVELFNAKLIEILSTRKNTNFKLED